MKAAMEAAAGAGALVYGHASHVYHTGANLYMIFHVDAGQASEVESRYRAVLDAALPACMATGGTLTHHHGVGLGKRDYIREELGDGGLDLLRRIQRAVDPRATHEPWQARRDRALM